MDATEYDEHISWLFKQFPSYQQIGSKAYKPTLDNTRNLIELLGLNLNDLKFVHVAGSNGKGSTASYLASTLTESGYKVGLFTSPHLLDFRERIRINGEKIEKESVLNFIHFIKSAQLGFSPSFFEISFCLALKHFIEKKCEICVIETGLGGRLDATNVITPILSVITSISLEHQHILGDTIEEIAFEKAGIIKDEVPIIVGSLPQNAKKVIAERAFQLKASFLEAETLPLLPDEIMMFLPEYQKENICLVSGILHYLKDYGFNSSEADFISGIVNVSANTGFSGRFQIISQRPTLVYDVSHNSDGFRRLFSHLQSLKFRKLHVIFGSSSDKSIAQFIDYFPGRAMYYLTEFSSERAMSIEKLEAAFENQHLDYVLCASPEDALIKSKLNADPKDLIIATGSFFLIADLMA